jgi:hypothetical protein
MRIAATLYTAEIRLTSGTKLLITYIQVINNNNDNNNNNSRNNNNRNITHME